MDQPLACIDYSDRTVSPGFGCTYFYLFIAGACPILRI
jgi:hypothetical protein